MIPGDSRWFPLFCGISGSANFIGFTRVFALGAVKKRIRPGFGPIWDFQNHASHPSRKHILDFQRFSCRCKCNMSMFCSPHAPFKIRTLARHLCTIIVRGSNCTHTHTPVQHIHFFANSWFSKTCSPLEHEAHFRFPGLSMPINMQHVRVLVTTLASRFVIWPLHGPFKNRALARELCTLTVQVPHSGCTGPT